MVRCQIAISIGYFVRRSQLNALKNIEIAKHLALRPFAGTNYMYYSNFLIQSRKMFSTLQISESISGDFMLA